MIEKSLSEIMPNHANLRQIHKENWKKYTEKSYFPQIKKTMYLTVEIETFVLVIEVMAIIKTTTKVF